MYQESPAIDTAEYHHIMYNYETLKLPPDSATTLKLGSIDTDTSALSGSEALTTVTLSDERTLVPSCISTPLRTTNVLTTTALSESVKLPTSSLSVTAPLTCTSLTNGIPLTAVTFSTTNSPSIVTTIPNRHYSQTSVSSPVAVATMSEVANSSDREDPIEISQIVHTCTSTDEVLDENLVNSPIDAVVTSMVAAADYQGVVSSGRKVPSQVIAKLFGDDSLNLDMVRIIADQDTEHPSHPSQSLNVLTRPGMLVHTKFANGEIVGSGNINQYRHVEVLDLTPSLRAGIEGSTPCSVVWTCSDRNVAFSSSEAITHQQEKECVENQSIAITATASQDGVESLMLPLNRVDDPTYMKLDKKSKGNKGESFWDNEYGDVWVCSVCSSDFPTSDELGKHHLSHSVEELSLALLNVTKPQKRQKNIDKASTTLVSAIATEQDNDSTDCAWSEAVLPVPVPSTVKEEVINNAGSETPPQTPPQENLIPRAKKKSSLKSSRENKSVKKKSGKKSPKETLKTPRQRKHKTHITGQSSRDPHTCPICNKVLSCRGNLAKHLVTHETDKPFTCKPCGLGFNAKRDQQYHYLQYHTNERPNICEICGKGYVFRQYLEKHMIYHGRERRFVCDICGKQFLTAKCVARHKKRHKKDRPYKCSICSKAFTVKADLSAHIRKIHHNGNKKGMSNKHQIDSSHKVTQSVQHTLKQRTHHSDSQSMKSKDVTEFLLPSGTTLPAQLLPEDLDSTVLSGTVSGKEEVFITHDPLASILPLNEIPVNEYSTAAEPMGDHTTYVMVNSADEEVASQNVTASHSLNIMYTTADAPVQQKLI